jgi:glycosyltransferase involved in cell wall biosynthesis
LKLDLVSIIVPVYNAEKYLKRCITSITQQTYKNIEIIIVNDGSTDSSIDVCKSFLSDERVVLIDKKNEGLSSSRQAGIDSARGKYICTVDADDYIEESFVEKMYSKISKEKSDICVCGVRHHFEEGTKVYGFNREWLNTRQIIASDIESNYYDLLKNYYMSDSWNKIYKKEFIKNSGVKFSLPKEYKGNDLLFNHLLLLHLPKISVLNESLYNYFVLENSLSRRKNKRLQKGFIYILNNILNEIEKLGYSDKINKEVSRLYMLFMYMSVINISVSGLETREFKAIINEFHGDNKKFLLNNRRVVLKTRYMDKISLGIVCYCLKSKKSSSMINFLRVRSTLLNLKR